MQEDMEKLTAWLDKSWWLTPNEKREAQNYDQSGDPLMDSIYAPANIVPIEDLSIDQAFNNATIKS
jgi:hypothetical protein